MRAGHIDLTEYDKKGRTGGVNVTTSASVNFFNKSLLRLFFQLTAQQNMVIGAHKSN